MEFQQFFDPFGSALQAQGKALQNEGQSLQNQTQLVKLGAAKEQLEALKKDNEATARAFAQWGTTKDPITGAESPTKSGNTPQSLYQAGKEGTPPDPIEQSLQEYQRNYKLNSAISQAKAMSDPKLSEAHGKMAMEALKGYEGVVKDRQKRDSTRADDLAQMLAEGAKSPEALGSALRMMQYKHPEFNPEVLEKQFGLKPGPNGVPIYDKDKLQSLANTALTMKDRLTLEHQKEQEKLTGELRDIERLRNVLREKALDQSAAKRRDGRGEKQEKALTSYVEKEKKSLHNEPVYKDFDKYESAIDRATNVEASLKAKGGYHNFTTSDAQALVAAGTNMNQGFRARYAGVREIELNNKLNGMIRNFEKTISSIGTGEKRLAPDTVPEFIQTMKNIYNERNEQVVKETLKRVQQVVKKGGDPDALEAKGSLPALIESGRAKTEKDKEGNTYVLVRRAGSQKLEDRYLIKKADKEED